MTEQELADEGRVYTPAEVVAEELRRFRERKGWSQQQLAGRLDELGHPIARSVIGKIEAGQRPNLPLDDTLALAAALNVSPVHLMAGTDLVWRVAVTPERVLDSREVRQWVRGQAALAGDDGRFYFSQVPDDEWVVARLSGVQHLLSLVQHFVDAAAQDERKRMVDLIEDMNDELERQRGQLKRDGRADSAGRRARVQVDGPS